MQRGLYTAATGMLHQRNRLDVIANNISNLDTKGFKKDQVVNRAFNDELLLRMGKNQIPDIKSIGLLNHGVYIDKVVTSFEQGNMEETNKNTHMALEGEGFFTVLANGGVQYTRDGEFGIDRYGRLVTNEGWPVMGEHGEIYVYDDNFTVDPNGNVLSGDIFVDKLRIVNFTNLEALRKANDNYFINSDPGANREIAFDGQVHQSFLEGSNIQPIREIVDMMTTSRAYESNQKILKMIDDSLGKAVNDVGRV